METTATNRSAGAAARSLRRQSVLGITLLAAGLLAAPMLARSAMAQRPATVQASAFVVDSYMSTGLRADSATVTGAAARPTPPSASHQVHIAGLGILDVRSGHDTEIRVESRFAEARDASGPTVRVSVSYLGN